MQMKKWKWFILLVLAIVLLFGCSPVPTGPAEPNEEETGQEIPRLPEQPEELEEPDESDMPPVLPVNPSTLPESMDTTFLIEGMEESITLNLFTEPDYPFYTYYPEDLLSETENLPAGPYVRFSANYGGNVNREAYVAVMVFQQELVSSEADFLDRITGESGVLTQRGYEWVEKADPIDLMHDWTFREYFFLSDTTTGALYAGVHEDTFFYIDIHYPWEFGEGLEARAAVILEHFTWLSNGKKLME